MKKRLLTLALGIATCFTLSAQVLVNSEGEQIKSVLTEEKPAGEYSIGDFYGSWNKDSEILGLGFGGSNSGGSSYWEMGVGIGLGDIDWFSYAFGFGLQHSIIGENFLLQIKAYPYIGINNFKEATYDSKTGKMSEDDKLEFAYGAQARLEAGLKLYETKKKNRVFLKVGYGISAPEFETKNMFDNGDWYVGLTIVR